MTTETIRVGAGSWLGLLLWLHGVTVSGYHCNYNATGPIQAIRPEVGDFGPILSVNYPNGYGLYQSFCEVKIEACYGCTIQVRFEEAYLVPCKHKSVTESTTSTCDMEDRCEYFIWSEAGKPSRRLAGNLTTLTVEADRSVRLQFCYSGKIDPMHYLHTIRRWKAVFAILDQYTYRVYGSAMQSGPNPAPSTGILRSPGFPQRYPENHTTYFIQGIVPIDRIRIVFDDFDIDPIASHLKIYDGPDRSNVSHTYRTRDERPIFTSSSAYVLIEFFPGKREASSYLHTGFKATYSFIVKDSLSELPNPVHQKCAPARPSEGGMVVQVGPPPGSSPVYHDCVWSLPTHYSLYMSVHVLEFKLSEVPYSRLPLLRQLEIRKAFHSDGKALTILYSEKLPLLPQEDLSARGGLYVRLRATLSDVSIVRFSYTPFRRENPKSGLKAGDSCSLERGSLSFQPGILCDHKPKSLWCIPSKLACDNVTHCKEASDENPPVCQEGRKAEPTNIITKTRVVPCNPPLMRCTNGRCAKTPEECFFLSVGSSCESQGLFPCRMVPRKCFKPNQHCDRRNDCGDWSDEDRCNYGRHDTSLTIFVQSLGNTWFFFLPAVILILTFVVGCVIYKTRKFRRLANSEGYIGAAPTDDIQLHTFTATAPPPYEEIIATTQMPQLAPPSDEQESLIASEQPESEASTAPKNGDQPPPAYEEITMAIQRHTDVTGAASSAVTVNISRWKEDGAAAAAAGSESNPEVNVSHV